MDTLRAKLELAGQQHLLKFYEDINEKQKELLERDIDDFDWTRLSTIFKEQVSTQLDGSKLKPVAKIDEGLLKELPEDSIGGTTRCSKEELDEYHSVGSANIRQGKVAALLLAGGQGTRLGVDYPKGMYDVGLPSHKSLFQLQAERILELSKGGQMILWYIMTSEATMEPTKEYFRKNNHFGLGAGNVKFFEQGTIPCFGFDGKVLLGDKHRVSRSPNGNGGLYEALHKNGIIEHMRANQVEYVHVYCVDNILVRVCDPTFLGFCIERQVEAGAKVIEKKLPNESVGVICMVDSRFRVIEYSEIPESIAEKRNGETGKLCFNAGNICDHFFSVAFLETVCGVKELRYHLAIKKILHVSLETGELVKPAEPNGIKLEKFIFDVFELTDKFVAWEVEREDEFSPLKNADGTVKDNPTTSRAALLRAYELGLLTV